MPKTVFVSFDGMDGSGKGWAVSHLTARLEEQGLKVLTGAFRHLVGSCYEAGKNPEQIPAYLARWKALKGELEGKYDAVILDRSPVTLIGWWGFELGLHTSEVLFEMIGAKNFADLSIVLQPPLDVCRERTLRSDRPDSKMAKTEEYFRAFFASTQKTVAFLKPRLGNRFVVFEDNEPAVEWAAQMATRLQTHFDMHLTNACPLKCPTCCFAAGENAHVPQDTEAHWYRIVDAGLQAGIREFHLMGGEPLVLGERLVALMRYIKAHGGTMHLLTSGYSLKHADDVLPLADAVFVSLDGPRDIHNATRGADIYDNAVEFTRRAAAHGCSIRIGTVVSRANVDTAPAVVRIVEELGITPRSACFMNMSPTGGLFASKHGNAPSSAAMERYLSADEWIAFVERLKTDPDIARHPWVKVEPAFSKRPEDWGCELLQGKRRVMVMSDGSMYLCPMLTPLPATHNILDGDPAERIVSLLATDHASGDPCGDGCQAGCWGYAALFGNGVCDARCGKQGAASHIPKRFRLSEARLAEGYRPACPCRTVRIQSL